MEDIAKRSTYEIYNGRQKTLVVVPAVFNFLAVLFTCFRLYSRRLSKLRILWDDIFCVIACVSS